MTIDEAIKLLYRLQGETPEQLATPMQQALELGIEALTRIQRSRKASNSEYWQLLPGETEK